MGPAILKKQIGETEYALRILPFGGSCAMVGEDTESDAENANQRFFVAYSLNADGGAQQASNKSCYTNVNHSVRDTLHDVEDSA